MEREEKITPRKAKGVTNNTVWLLQNIHAAIHYIKYLSSLQLYYSVHILMVVLICVQGDFMHIDDTFMMRVQAY